MATPVHPVLETDLMRRFLTVAVPICLLSLLPGSVAGQFYLGAHAGYTGYQGGGPGGGAKVGFDLPALPIDLLGNVEWFSPSCDAEADGCSMWGGSLDVNARLPIPLVRPYLTGGWSFRQVGPGGDAEEESKNGPNLGLGVDVHLGIRIFGDARYEFLGEDSEDVLVRLGIIFNL